MKRLIGILVLAGVTGCGAQAPATDEAFAQAPPHAAALPDLTAVRINGPDGKPTLTGWRAARASGDAPGLRYRVLQIEPENPVFAGARAFGSSWDEADPVAAAKKAAAAEGFATARVMAQAAVDPAIAARFEPNGKVTAVMLAGTLNGLPAHFGGYVWYGAHGEPDGKAASGVHGFVAPEPVFVALGGSSVPAILFGIAVATPQTPMSADGARPAEVQVRELADLFAGWASARASGDNLSTLNTIMQGNLGVQSGTGCINMMGCVGGGQPPVYTPQRY